MSTLGSVKSVTTIDCDYTAPEYAAAYLVVEGKRAAFVENNTAHAVPKLIQALKRAGLAPEQVDYLIITHVHLDHAGGTSALLKLCPNASVLAHPRAARHVIDPAKLIASARQVYGEKRFAELYGEIVPVDASRVRTPADGETLAWGSREFKFIYTRGHANHHFCIHDSGSSGIFTGDSFGLAYPRFQGPGLFLIPSTSPTDFDPEEARASVAKIRASGATRAYLTHFGEIALDDAACAEFLRHLEFTEALLERAVKEVAKKGAPRTPLSPADQAALARELASELERYYAGVLQTRGRPLTSEDRQFLALDLELNGAGIVHKAIAR